MDIEIVEVRIPKAINSVEFNQGIKGDRGVSITDFTLDDDGNAVTTFDNGETKTSKLTSIASASASAKKAAASESNAKDYADKALASETNAKTSETNAVTYEDNAKKSEIAAKTSETNAAASASTATAQASNAGKSATAAKTSETNAKSSETASATSAANAKASASNAAISASNSASSASASEVSSQYSKKWAESTESPDGSADTDSTTGKTQSSRSWALYSKAKAQESASSATSASDSASAAASSAASSSDSKDKASEYKTSASGSATAAASSASSASTSATNAKAAMNTANTAASSASTSAINASTSASNASKSEVAAKSAQAEAERARDEANSALAKISGALKYMGQVDNYNDLPSTGNSKGDTWNVVNADPSHHIKAGDNVAWNGTEWDDLSGVVDLSAYAEKADCQKAITSATANGATITFNHKDGTTSTATVNNVASATVATNDAKGQKIDTTYEKIADASNVHTSLQNSINTKQDKLTFDTTPTDGSTNPVTSDGVKKALDNKQDKTGKGASGTWGINVTGNANTATKANDSSKLGGYPLTAPGGYYNAVPFVQSDGVMEIGKYIDWHITSDDTGDYSSRWTAEKDGTISVGTINGTLKGNADRATTATKLQTARTISLTGDITGSATFDGSSNISINTSKSYVVGETKRYTVDLSTLDTTKFYPIIFDPESIILQCEIHSPSLLGGDESYNQNTISFSLLAKGWSDIGYSFSIDAYNVYQSNEITIGCIGTGSQDGCVCVWVRGGMSYLIVSNRKPILHAEDITFTGGGTETYTVGTNYYGGTGNRNVSIIFTPQQTITSGPWHNGTAYGLFERATKDASGNVITDTYAKKTDVTVKGVKVDGATSPLVPDSSGVVTIPKVDLSDYATISSLSSYQTKITFDSTPTANSSNPVTSAGIKAAIDAKTVDLSNYYTKTQVDSAISTAISAIVDGDSKSY